MVFVVTEMEAKPECNVKLALNLDMKHICAIIVILLNLLLQISGGIQLQT